MRIVFVAGVLLTLCACKGVATPEPVSIPGTVCSTPRPQVCTMEYNPVCANLAVGGTKQYASGCNACADDAVVSYLPDTCPTDS